MAHKEEVKREKEAIAETLKTNNEKEIARIISRFSKTIGEQEKQIVKTKDKAKIDVKHAKSKAEKTLTRSQKASQASYQKLKVCYIIVSIC